MMGTVVAHTAPYNPKANSNVERQNSTFVTSLRSFVNARQNDWDGCLVPYEFAYNSSVNVSLGETPFMLNHGRHPRIPASVQGESDCPAAHEFVLSLHNKITAARDHIRATQGRAADVRAKHLTPPTFAVGDKVLLSTEHYNLKLPSRKLTPRWLGPLTILQIRGPNTVLIEVPPRLANIHPLQNVQHLKPYVSRGQEVGPVPVPPEPNTVEGHEEFEVEVILAHRKAGAKTEYLVRFKGYGPEDDLWLPKGNLVNAPDVVAEYEARREDNVSTPRERSGQRAPRRLRLVGHVFEFASQGSASF